MADLSFDVVVLGGGLNGLISAAYFAKYNNLSVGVFEMMPELGGGQSSAARPVPGFVGNPHAHLLVSVGAIWMADFKIWEKGLRLLWPENNGAAVWPDGTGIRMKMCCDWDKETGMPTLLPELLEENIESLAKIDANDAKTLAGVYEKLDRSWLMALLLTLNNPPPPYPQLTAVEELYTDPNYPVDQKWQYMDPIQQLRDWGFQSPKFIAYLFRWLQMGAVWPDRPVHPEYLLLDLLLPLGVFGVGNYVGGTHQFAHAFQRVLADYKAKTYTNCAGDKIIVENGRAKGIKLTDGTEIEAKMAVVCNIEPRQLINRLLRDFPISDAIKGKVNNIRSDIANLFWGNICYHERPQYIAEDFAPGVGDSYVVILGDDDIEYIYKEYRYRCQHVKPGQWPPKLYFWESSQSLFDPTVAPPGKHLSLVEEYGPPVSALSEEEWVQLRREAGPRILEEWRKYAPNMTGDNIIGFEVDTPWDCERRDIHYEEGSWLAGVSPTPEHWGRNRPITELSQFQVPGIENLFLCGQHTHPADSSRGTSGYVCYKVAANKLGLRKIWEEEGRLF